MDEKSYLAERVDHQINWMEENAAANQTKYKTLRTLSLIASILIPLLSGFSDNFGVKITIIVGVLGAIIAICQGLLALNRYHEAWTEYRITAEALKREKLVFATKTAPYSGPDSFHLFVENTEKILAGENHQNLTPKDMTGIGTCTSGQGCGKQNVSKGPSAIKPNSIR
jgi:Protein of unknown function (DUF4231)